MISGRSLSPLNRGSDSTCRAASRVERELGVSLPEETMAAIETPKEFVELVNSQLMTSA